MTKIRLGIVGYGNVGRGVEYAISQNDDMELVAVFTRRNPDAIKTVNAGVKVFNIEEAAKHINTIDVMMLCGGSATDLMDQTPYFSARYNCVDSFDTHAQIPEHFKNVDEAARKSKKISIISTGWDPGLFSILRALGIACLPQGCDYTFWGKGVSQGHSDALRRIAGVRFAVQYTIPVDSTVEAVRKGKNPILTPRQKHIRECFVVAEAGANMKDIEQNIKTMPNYFCDYDTFVHFISEEQFEAEHQKMPHGGFVFRTGTTGNENAHRQCMEFSLQLESNPEFTANVMVAYARAAHRLCLKGESGAKTVFDIPVGLLLPDSMEIIRKNIL